MTLRALGRLLTAYALLVVVVLFVSYKYFSLKYVPESARIHVVSTWRDAELASRKITAPGELYATDVATQGKRVVEEDVAEGPLLTTRWLFELGVVPGRDGIAATLDGKTSYVTVDDLLVARAYDHTPTVAESGLGIGVDREVVFAKLGADLGVSARDVLDRASIRRVRFVRSSDEQMPQITADSLTRAMVVEGVHEAAHYLARNIDERGRFRYIVDAPTNRSLAGYNWPRHAGATFFLAQASVLDHDPEVTLACLRAAATLRDDMMKDCGDHKCIGEEDVVDVGSSALALLAFDEIVRRDVDRSYLPAARALADFLRSQQRADGEFMHEYDRAGKKPIDVQRLYYSGEATLALARAHRVTNDPRDLDAASRGLARLVGSGWHFFGDHYYFSEEHWTCQAMEDLWERAPNIDALAFCERWHEYQRRLQYGSGESGMDAEGAFGVGPFISPRLTPASSRGEAAGATLAAVLHAMKKGQDAALANDTQRALLSRELDSAIAFVLRHQWRPGPTHLFRNPALMRGGIPGSAVDWQIRIDYLQHAGSMMMRWLEIHDADETPKK